MQGLIMVLVHLRCTVQPFDVGQWINVPAVWADRSDGRLRAPALCSVARPCRRCISQ
jgi:hypothetical protein